MIVFMITRLILNLLLTVKVESFYRNTMSSLLRPPSFRLFSGVDLLRLERILGNRGAGSRTEAAKMIRQGRVVVDKRVIKSGSARFPSNCKVEIDGKDLPCIPLLALFHKPIGMVSSIGDPWGRSHLGTLSDRWSILSLMHPVGRLDLDTSGLLLFSRDGRLTQALLNPSSSIPRTYIAVVEGIVDIESLRKILAQGVETTEGKFPAMLINAEVLKEEQLVLSKRTIKKMIFDDDDDDDGDDDRQASDTSKATFKTCSKVTLSVCEGKYRMVRRILNNAGHPVVSLHRVSYGSIRIGDLTEGDLSICSQGDEKWANEILRKKI
jgi:23S rRNA pseudouridine2605 synthase